jgi:Ser/Thr protein kinase RdoA (MazF antagonist)
VKQGFFELTPHSVLGALEQLGFEPNGYLTQLNSYENRVFSIDMEDGQKVVAKFYRPERWSKAAILEEHSFLFELKKEGIPVVAPMILSDGSSLKEWEGMQVAVFEKMRGRSPDELLENDFERIGRRLAQIHNVGARSVARNRLSLYPGDYVENALDVLQPRVSPELWSRYDEVADTLLDYLEDELSQEEFIRLHGDCHKGNLIWNGEEFYFVDFDDCLNGPVVQDLWMLTQGNREELDLLLKGYTQLRSFDENELHLVEPLRGLRMIYYSTWIAKRWEDPSFPKLFPHFATHNYWLDELDRLEKIVAQI